MSPASAPVENAYHVMSEVRYECHAGFVMKGGADSLKCHATGCWMPNELPTCVRYALLLNSCPCPAAVISAMQCSGDCSLGSRLSGEIFTLNPTLSHTGFS